MGTTASSLPSEPPISKTLSSSVITTSLSASPSTSTNSLSSTSNATTKPSLKTDKTKPVKRREVVLKHKLKDDIKLWPLHTPNNSGKLPKKSESHTSSSASHQQRWTSISNARLIVREPMYPNGAALLIIAGGGYNFIMEKESQIPAKYFADKGFYTFELIYRLPKETGYKYASFQDAQRAIRVIRSYGKQQQNKHLFHKIGAIGFSAGGHLLAVSAVRNLGELYTPQDMIDEQESDELDFVALLYPVINMLPPYNITQAYDNIIGSYYDDDTNEINSLIIKDEQIKFSPHLHVTANTPPLYIVHAGDDNISPVMNSVLMYQATLDLLTHMIPHTQSQSDKPIMPIKTPSHLTIFQSGGHGFRMGKDKKETSKNKAKMNNMKNSNNDKNISSVKGGDKDTFDSTDDEAANNDGECGGFDMTNTWPESFLAWLKLNKFIVSVNDNKNNNDDISSNDDEGDDQITQS